LQILDLLPADTQFNMAITGKTQLEWVAVFLCVSMQCVAAEAEHHWSGDAGLNVSYYQSDYVSRTLSASSDLVHKFNQHETGIEATVDNQYVTIPGSTSGISRFRYDANVKWKYYYAETPYYSYLSPRVRHNDAGLFTAVQALRTGGGRKFLFDENRFQVTLEAGIGYRYATMADNSKVQEELVIFTTKCLWDISPSTTMKFNLTQEQSALEKYRTTTLELKNKVTEDFALKFQIAEKRTYPYDISVPNGEVRSSIGIDYEI
jgi:putative salt-induced outer membrane protein